MRKTKLIALLLVVAMIASMVVPGVTAAAGTYTISIVDNTTGAATINANAGDKIMLKVVLSNNPGVSGVAVNINYPEDWACLGKKDGKLFDDTAETVPTFSENNTANPFYGSWVMPYGTTADEFEGIAGKQLSTENGMLLQIQFQIPENAATGTYTVDLDFPSVDNYAFATKADGTVDPNVKNSLTPAAESLTVNVTGAEPEAPASDPTQVACPCAVCNGAVPTWQVWSGTETSGHYYLNGEITLGSEISLGNNKLVLNLNGNDIVAGSVKRFYIASSKTGVLDILDATAHTDAEGNYVAGAIRGGNANGTSDATKRGGNICNYGKGTVNIHSGKITGGQADRGGNIYVHTSGYLNIYGGLITGGSATWGGNEIMARYTTNVYGGNIIGTKSTKIAFHHMNGTLNIYGGNISSTGSALGITGSESGKGTTAYMYGGTVSKCGSMTYTSTLTMYGGTITVLEDISTCTVTLYNGVVGMDSIAAHLADCACAQKNADGTYTVWNYDANCTNCAYKTALATDGDYITVQTGEHSNPMVDANSSTGFVCGFCGAEMESSISTVTRTCPVHGEQSYFVWDGQATSGHYYLTADVNLDGEVEIASGNTVCIDLAGCDITAAENQRVFYNNGELQIIDTVGGGVISGNGAIAENGGVINNTGTVYLRGGTIANGIVTGKHYGGNIYSIGTLYMYAGVTVTNGQSESHGGNIDSANNSSLYIYGGTISNGICGVYEGAPSTSNFETAPMGGNLYVTASNANGGAGKILISNATITGGQALLGQGGNVMINNYREDVTISDCTISGGNAVGSGHELWLSNSALVLVTDTVIGASAANADATLAAIGVRGTTTTRFARLRIGAGVTSNADTTYYLHECAQLTDVSAGTYVTYAELTDALAAAESGDTVTMGADAEAEEVRVKSGITLDLNGKTLTADAVSSTANGAAIIDGVGNAKLVVDEMDAAAFAAANGQLPVYYDGAYTFENVTFKEKLEASETSATYKFYIDKESTKTLIDDAIRAGNDVSINVKVAWTYNGETETKIFTMDTAKLQQLVAGDNWDTKMVVLNITYDEGVVITDCAAQVVSDGVILEA